MENLAGGIDDNTFTDDELDFMASQYNSKVSKKRYNKEPMYIVILHCFNSVQRLEYGIICYSHLKDLYKWFVKNKIENLSKQEFVQIILDLNSTYLAKRKK